MRVCVRACMRARLCVSGGTQMFLGYTYCASTISENPPFLSGRQAEKHTLLSIILCKLTISYSSLFEISVRMPGISL